MKHRRDYSEILLWSAVLVGAPRWMGAMLAADMANIEGWLSSTLNVANMVSGLMMGLLEVVAVAYMLDALRGMKAINVKKDKRGKERAKPNYRYFGTLLFAGGLLLLTPLILAPYMVSRMEAATVANVLGSKFWRYAWSVCVVVSPVFIIAGIAFSRPGFVEINAQNAKNKPVASATDKRGNANEVIKCECGFEARNRFSLSAHKKACPMNQPKYKLAMLEKAEKQNNIA